MPNKYGGDPKVSEEERAETSRIRGQVAAGIADPAQKKKFIAEQAANRLTDSQLREDAYSQRNQNAVADVAPKMHTGGKVPRTGKYTLKKGEEVLTEKKAREAGVNQKINERAAHALSTPRRGAGNHAEGRGTHPGADGHKRIKKMSIEPGHSGGYIVRHEHHQPEGAERTMTVGHEEETHVVPTLQALHDHLEEHLGGEPGAEAGDDAAGGAGEEQGEQGQQ